MDEVIYPVFVSSWRQGIERCDIESGIHRPLPTLAGATG
jgi:hypothetical protein